VEKEKRVLRNREWEKETEDSGSEEKTPIWKKKNEHVGKIIQGEGKINNERRGALTQSPTLGLKCARRARICRLKEGAQFSTKKCTAPGIKLNG